MSCRCAQCDPIRCQDCGSAHWSVDLVGYQTWLCRRCLKVRKGF